ncbi:MAG: hypothetical protein KDJ82_05040 [Rhodobacteraceae bacterium]|nr:hypothetical protein [Paracoccaceae bacterium]
MPQPGVAPIPVVPAHHYRPTYSEADLASLCCEFHIPTGMQPEIASCLEDAAAIWRWYGGATAGHPTRGASAKALRTVATSASGLKAALAALPMPAADALAAQVVKAESASLKGQHILTGLPVISILHDDGTSAQAVLDLSELAHLVDALESMAISAEADLPKASTGARGVATSRPFHVCQQCQDRSYHHGKLTGLQAENRSDHRNDLGK